MKIGKQTIKVSVPDMGARMLAWAHYRRKDHKEHCELVASRADALALTVKMAGGDPKLVQYWTEVRNYLYTSAKIGSM